MVLSTFGGKCVSCSGGTFVSSFFSNIETPTPAASLDPERGSSLDVRGNNASRIAGDLRSSSVGSKDRKEMLVSPSGRPPQ